MPLQILSSPSSPDELVEKLSSVIAEALPGSQVEVQATGAGHFEIRVASETFEGQSRVAQQQAVYAAIAHLMKGDSPPVHAVDQLTTL